MPNVHFFIARIPAEGEFIAGDGRRSEFLRGAFDEWLASEGAGRQVRICVDHQLEFGRMPLATEPHVTLDGDTLQVLFGLNTRPRIGQERASEISHGAVLAVRQGFLRGISMGFGGPKDGWHRCVDRNGEEITLISRATIGEVTLTDRPAIAGTSIQPLDPKIRIPSIAVWPHIEADADCLEQFLKDFGIEPSRPRPKRRERPAVAVAASIAPPCRPPAPNPRFDPAKHSIVVADPRGMKPRPTKTLLLSDYHNHAKPVFSW